MYCTLDDILKSIPNNEIINLTNDYDEASSVNEDVVIAKIQEQSQYIDGYLTARYKLPITNTKDLVLLRNICVNLVVCELYSRRFVLDYSDSLVSRRKNAIADMEKIQKGIILLDDTKEEQTLSKSKRTVSKPSGYFTNELLSKL